MTMIQRSILLVLLFLLASSFVILASFVLVVVLIILLMEILPVLKNIDIKIYQSLVFIFILGCYSYVMGTIIGKPLLAIVGWLKGLSEGKYNRQLYAKEFAFLWNKQKKIKWYYVPFKDILLRLQELSISLELNQQEIKRANEAKEQWLSGVSHDLKTPLSYVKGYLELIFSPDIAMTKDERDQALHVIKQKVADIEGLINTFQFRQERSIALRTRGDLVRYLRELTLDAANNPRAASYYFTFEANVTAFEYFFDPKLLKRVMQNLLINAVIHNPRDTEITVRLEIKDYVFITVTDNGVGMPSSVIHNLLRKNGFRDDTKVPNSEGIGLSVVKALIDEHHGGIDVESMPNQGTTLTIKLPLHTTE